jgi:hypothetical protein
MHTHPSSISELEQLKQELAALRQEVKELQRCVQIQPADPAAGTPLRTTIKCTELLLVYRGPEGRDIQARLSASKSGPTLIFYGLENAPGLQLHAGPDMAEFRLFTQHNESAVELSVEAGSGRGSVCVCEAGKPRAIMKAAETGAAISVVHDDGRVRAMLHADIEKGEVMVVTPESKTAVKISGEALGGLIAVNRRDGQTGGVLLATEAGGSLMLHDRQGKSGVALHQSPKGPILALTGENGHVPVFLAALEGRGQLELREPAGAAMGLKVAADSAAFSMVNAQDKAQVYLGYTAERASLHLKPNDESGCAASIFTQDEGGAVLVSGTDGMRRAGICATRDGGQLTLFNDLGIERVMLGSADDGGVLKLNWGGTIGVAALAAEAGGAILVNDAAGQVRASLPPVAEEEE